MNNLKLSAVQTRFLVIWILFHSFALFVNLNDIEGRIGNDDLFTQSYSTDSFWPFVSFSGTYHQKAPITDYTSDNYNSSNTTYLDKDDTYFKGIFYSYNITAFVFYIILGFSIVYVAKLWKEQTAQA
jgi:hypothetical protein